MNTPFSIESQTGAGREFPDTQWSQLLLLRDAGHPAYASAMDGLARHYWKPVFHYVRALRRVSAEDAQDLTQEFFAMLLRRHDLEKLEPQRGSFRGFLKTALRHFLASADRARSARLPRGGARLFPVDEAEREWIAGGEATPEEAFDRAWSRQILQQAIEELKTVLTAEHREQAYELFRAYCLEPAGLSSANGRAPEPPTYGELAGRFGISVDDVQNRLRAARQRLRLVLYEIVSTYLGPDADIEAELNFILS